MTIEKLENIKKRLKNDNPFICYHLNVGGTKCSEELFVIYIGNIYILCETHFKRMHYDGHVQKNAKKLTEKDLFTLSII